MTNITWEPVANGNEAFIIREDDRRLGEMVTRVDGETMTVYHTEIAPEAEGEGLAKQLLNRMVDHAREHHLKVIPLCVFVQAQFKRHPEMYADIWQKTS